MTTHAAKEGTVEVACPAIEDSRTLSESAALWDRHARHDPLWAILSDPEKKGRRWDVARFFQTGVGEISWLLYRLRSRGVAFNRESALDFGCGVGRLTQALASHFDRVVGIDVSARMIALAADMNRFGDRVVYTVNTEPHLRIFRDDTFDFVVSNLVLQHIDPAHAAAYVSEFLRVLRPAGMVVFQVPSHRRGPDDGAPQSVPNAMPDEAYRASLQVTGIPAGAIEPGAKIRLTIDVENASELPWSQHESGVVRVGNHWRDGSGTLLMADDGRSSLPSLMRAGERAIVSLTITAPETEGNYICEIDLAHEGVLWFREKGSEDVRFNVRVRDAATGVAHDPMPPETTTPATAFTESGLSSAERTVDGQHADEPAAFPMYGLPKAQVLDVIAAHGGELVEIEDDRSCGDDWISFRYFVRKTQ